MSLLWKIETKLKWFIAQKIKNQKVIEYMDNAYYLFIYPFEWLRYKAYLKIGKVYFGNMLCSSQGNPYRHSYMSKIVEMASALNQKINILEIGSWAGASAIAWAEAIKHYSSGRGHVVCVEPWKSYLDLNKNKRIRYKEMKRALKNDAILKLFFHNIRCSKNDDVVIALRDFSDICLPMLKEKQFDIIYIDGDHSYQGVLKDLKNSDRLLKDGAILCGDDLELQAHELSDELKIYRGNDFIMDPKTKTFFHSGVTLAVWDFFKQDVSCFEGFWAMRKTGDGYKKVVL